jgi:hypothetical protein
MSSMRQDAALSEAQDPTIVDNRMFMNGCRCKWTFEVNAARSRQHMSFAGGLSIALLHFVM